MKFIRTAGWDDGVADLTERLVRELAKNKRVLWIISGGSNIPVSVQIMDNISSKLSRYLTILPGDERYGHVGHKDSNWAQLLNAGFNLKKAAGLSVLNKGMDFAHTLENYRQLVKKSYKDNQVIIAQLGIGEDGHISGILPNSPASMATKELVVGYKDKFFTRLTLTFAGLQQISVAYAFAFGSVKNQALTTLQNSSLAPNIQPAQILKKLPEAYAYSDQFGENSL
ncbi:MAG TPA: 6-phosphogluconolactonase [Candidatus Saccharimonadales bacterium]|nr:6-phosphogluconolactonase [Candidatus Saccharimonadales bacterium]